MRFLLPLFLAFSAWAQPDPIWKKLIAVPTTISKFQPDEFVWIFSDMPTNINVTNWVDEHFSSHWTNAFADATRPTNSSLGVHFTAANTQRLTNNITFGNTSTHFIILKTEKTTGFWDILDKDLGGALEWGFTSTKWQLIVTAFNKLVDGNPGSSSFFDFAVVSDDVAHTLVGYTNGIPYVTNTASTISGPWSFMGGIAAEGWFTGWIKEFWVRTNTAETATQIAVRHTTATNTYGYSP